RSTVRPDLETRRRPARLEASLAGTVHTRWPRNRERPPSPWFAPYGISALPEAPARSREQACPRGRLRCPVDDRPTMSRNRLETLSAQSRIAVSIADRPDLPRPCR